MHVKSIGMLALSAALLLSIPALAADEPEPGAINFSGYIEAGATANFNSRRDGTNFGHLFTDKPNQALLNQAVLTLDRALQEDTPSWGFKLQGMYGSDARYTHFLGVLDNVTKSRNQFDIVEAFVSFRMMPEGTKGIDVKIGQFVTLLGAETIDPNTNYLYSHSYIFNFGLPLKHTGVMTISHLNETLDVYLGFDTGVNTSIGNKGDNNDALAFQGGIGLNGLADGKVTVLATMHVGPENPKGTAGVRPNKDLRWLADVVITTKATEELTWISEFNWIRDDGFNAEGYGTAQYLIYALNEEVSLVGRLDLWRDRDGFFVASFPGNRDFLNLQKGKPATVIGGGKTTYGALTAGVNFKPDGTGLTIRPELRYDRSLNSTRPFDSGRRKDQGTAGVDVIFKF